MLIDAKLKQLKASVTHNNTKITRDIDTIRVMLHRTEIVTFFPLTGIVKLNTGGYHTSTTKKRINEVLAVIAPRYRVVQDRGDWFVISHDNKIDFDEGILIQGLQSITI